MSKKFSKIKFLKRAQDHIDAIMIKPLNLETILENLAGAIESSALRKNYLKFVAQAASLCEQGDVKQAENYLTTSLRLSKKPVLSYCMLGEILTAQKQYKIALQYFFAALKMRPQHYRALKGMFHLFQNTGRAEEAYSALKKIFSIYPADPEELCQAFRLCIQTDQLDDMNHLLTIYLEQNKRHEELNRYAAAAVSVLCRHLIECGAPNDRVFENAGNLRKIPVPRGPFIKPLAAKLRDKNNPELIVLLLKIFGKDEMKSDEYKLCRYFLYTLNETDDFILEYSMKLVDEGIKDQLLYKETINRLVKLGNRKGAQALKDRAETLWS